MTTHPGSIARKENNISNSGLIRQKSEMFDDDDDPKISSSEEEGTSKIVY